MSQTWYCRVDGQVYGPFSWEQLRAMADEGRVVAATAVRRSGEPSWTAASEVEGLVRLPVPPPLPLRDLVSPAARPPGPPVADVVGANGGGAASRPAGESAAPGSSGVRNGSATPESGRSADESQLVRPRRPRWLEDENKPAVAPPPPPSSGPSSSPLPVLGATPLGSEDKPNKPKRGSGRLTRLAGAVAAIVLGVTFSLGLLAALALAWARSVIRKEVATAMAAYQAELAAKREKNPEVPGLTAPANAAAAPPAGGTSVKGRGTPAPQSLAKEASTAAAASSWRAEAEKVVSAMAAWHDVTQIRGIDLLGLKLQVRRAWLAVNERGARRETSKDTVDDETPPPAGYVFVEVSLRNTGAEPRMYTSWNALAGASAVLADEGGSLFEFVPPSETPEVSRRGAVQLGPGDALTDLLVFRAPEGEVTNLRLALAKRALAGKARVSGGTHFGFQIPSSLLADDAVAPSADP